MRKDKRRGSSGRDLRAAINVFRDGTAICIMRVCTTLITLRPRNFHRCSRTDDDDDETRCGERLAGVPRSYETVSKLLQIPSSVRGTIEELNFKVT